MPNNHHYTPDVLINDNLVIELKPSRHLEYEDKERWELEQSSIKEYCNNNNMIFQNVFDTDIGFETKKYKHYLKNNQNIILKYNIRFNKPISEWSF